MTGAARARREHPRDMAVALRRRRRRTVGSPTRRQSTVALYANGGRQRASPAQELRPRRSRRGRTATRAHVPGRARTALGRVAADAVSDGACGVRGRVRRHDPPATGCGPRTAGRQLQAREAAPAKRARETGARDRAVSLLRRYGRPLAEPLGLGRGANGFGPDLAPAPSLLAMALDLAGELLLAQVDRVPKVARAIVRAQGHTLQSQGGLRHLVVGDGRIALLVDLDLETRELRHLLAHLREPPLDVLAERVRHGGVATLDLDLHRDPLGRFDWASGTLPPC